MPMQLFTFTCNCDIFIVLLSYMLNINNAVRLKYHMFVTADNDERRHSS